MNSTKLTRYVLTEKYDRQAICERIFEDLLDNHEIEYSSVYPTTKFYLNRYGEIFMSLNTQYNDMRISNELLYWIMEYYDYTASEIRELVKCWIEKYLGLTDCYVLGYSFVELPNASETYIEDVELKCKIETKYMAECRRHTINEELGKIRHIIKEVIDCSFVFDFDKIVGMTHF